MSTIVPYALNERALDADDIDFLKTACRQHLNEPDSIPSYVLIDLQESAAFQKIKALVEKSVAGKVHYLNDFYLYTDETFGANWHMDTELYTFRSCVNAWILLGPETVKSPLAFMKGVNDGAPEDGHFHDMKVSDGTATFTNYCNATRATFEIETLEQERICAPDVNTGDVLLFDPRQFHRTNIKSPKHIIALKFVIEDGDGMKSEMQMPELLWPETRLFNGILKDAQQWDDVTCEVRAQLKTEKGRKVLSDGFFPEKKQFYREKIAQLQ